jgi:ribonuclease R
MTKKSPKGAGSRRKRDPFAEREAAKYERPIPSREYLMEFLAEHGAPMSIEQIAPLLNLQEEQDRESLRRRLNAMERDGQLIRNRRNAYLLVDKSDLVRGRVIGHPDGFGFLVPDEGGDDLFLSPRQMRSVFHDDVIVGRVVGVDFRGRREGAVVEVLERNTHQVVGRFFQEGGVSFVTPDNKRISQDISVPVEHGGEARHGQIVTVEIVEQPSRRRPPIGRVVEILGDHMAAGMEIDVAIRTHELPLAWPAAVAEEIAGLKDTVSPAAKQGREDLRQLPLVTIDGADARDFDDAVYCERTPKGWRLLVAIADVSHYVRPGKALDEEARARGNSVYFPERVIPMLPEILSNGLCSLNPEVDRLCMVCEMYFNLEGKMLRSRFLEGVMFSHARLTYDQVAAIVVGHDRAARQRFGSLVPHLEELHRLYTVLQQARLKRGAIDFDTTETQIVFGPNRKIEKIVPIQRNDAHRMIEECMISANVAAARLLARHKLPTLYRIHDGPKTDKLAALREFLGELGLSLRGGDKPQARDFANLLTRVQGRPDAHLIQTVMLRSLSQAVYHPENIGHFGLALDQYLHFTSPIRRYPDLIVHRAIRHVLAAKRKTEQAPEAGTPRRGRQGVFSYTEADMIGLGDHCSMTERRADDATRDAVDWLKCEYMVDKVGEDYPGIVSSVTSFGIFVELADIYVEGLVHVTALKNDYYHFEPAGHRLVGERSATVYRLGDKIRVKVVRVDLDDRKIDFELADSSGKPERRVARGPGQGKKKRTGGRRTTRKRG